MSAWSSRSMVALALSCAAGLSACLTACQPPATSDDNPVLATGRFATADLNDPDVQEAARFAVQTWAVQHQTRVLYKDVLQAERQVVAGIHFKMRLLVLQGGQPQQVEVLVWRKLDGAYVLSSWTSH